MKNYIRIPQIFFLLIFTASAQQTIPPLNGTSDTRPFLMNVGDFDGDGSDDVLFVGEVSGSIDKIAGVYSILKKSYLFEYNVGGILPDEDIIIGDFNGDGLSDVIIKYKYYNYSTVPAKKKVF